MRDLLEDFVLPWIVAIFCVMLFILVAGGIGGLAGAFIESRECKVWGGEYHLSTGCLMKVDGIMITLDDYKAINRASIEKPIETNTNIRIKGERR